jgi:hypothetical protein
MPKPSGAVKKGKREAGRIGGPKRASLGFAEREIVLTNQRAPDELTTGGTGSAENHPFEARTTVIF